MDLGCEDVVKAKLFRRNVNCKYNQKLSKFLLTWVNEPRGSAWIT